MIPTHWFPHIGLGCGAVAIGLVIACSSKSSGNDITLANVDNLLEPNAGSCASPGGPVAGPQDDHCDLPDGGTIVQPTTMAGCFADAGPPGDDGGGDDGGGVDAGDIGNCGDGDYGATMNGTSGSDDDCKYNVTWTSTPICENQETYFVVSVSKRTDNSPLTGANARPDVVLNCEHPISNLPRDPSPEISPGTYIVGPIVFDQPGKWVFRFHFNEDCLDLAPDSPHGHAAFYINVP
jgi:hypothetical protein